MSDYPPESRRSRREAERRSRRQETEDEVPRSFFADLRGEEDEPDFGGGIGAQRPRYPQAAEPDPGYVQRERARPRYPQPEEPPPAPPPGYSPVGPPAQAPQYSREPQFPPADSTPGYNRQPPAYPPPPAAPVAPSARRREPRRGDRGVRWDEPEIPAPLLGQDSFETQQPSQLRTDRPAPRPPAPYDTRARGLPVREITGDPTTALPAPPAYQQATAYLPPLIAEPPPGLLVHQPDDEWDEDEDDEEPAGPLRLWLLRLAALLLIGWTLLTLVPGGSGIVAMLAAAAPLIAAVAIPVIMFAVHDQRWGCVAVSAIAALLPWALVVGYAAPGRGVPTAGPVVRVMTANARLGLADPKQLVAAVHDHAVDVLVVTELTGALAHSLTVAGLDTELVPRWVKLDADPSGGIGVWSRFPIEQIEDLPGFTRPAGRMVVRTQQGPVTLVAVHTKAPYPPRFPFRDDAARWQSDLLRVREVARQTGGPQVVVGDFNATPWNADFRVLSDAGLADAADVAGRGIRPTWPAWLPFQLLPLDHVMLGGQIGVASVATLDVTGSDHRALLVALRIAKTG